MPMLADDDVVEVPCVVSANGARPLTVGAVPDGARDLIVRVKEYERLTLRAAESGAPDDAVRALAAHPLIESPELAATLVRALQPW
jgi:6-phospho-beta-glucosidase